MTKEEVKELVNVARLLFIQRRQWTTSSPKTLRNFMKEICDTDLQVAEENLPSETQIKEALAGQKDSYLQDIREELAPLVKMVLMRLAHDAMKGNTKAAEKLLEFIEKDGSDGGGTAGGLNPIVFSADFNTDRYEEVQGSGEGAGEREAGIGGAEESPQIEERYDGDGGA